MDEQMVEQVSADDGFGDFASAFGEEFGNQTEEPAEEAETEETGGEDAQQTEDGQDSAGDDTGAPSEAAPDAETDPPAEPDPADSFTIKVNKQERTVTRKEMISLAQKGSDYDRVKQQLTESREAAKNLQTRLDQQAETMNLLEMLAQSSNMTTDKLIEAMYVSVKRGNGLSEDAAKEAYRADRLQWENTSLKNQKTEAQTASDAQVNNAQKELEEFRAQYPDVNLDEALVDKLLPDVQKGMTLSGAYRKMEDAKKDAQIAELQRQLAAEKQNKKNSKASPGSQADAGGRRTKSDFEDFSKALFG